MQRRTEFVAKAEMVGRTKAAGFFAWLKIASRQLLFLTFHERSSTSTRPFHWSY